MKKKLIKNIFSAAGQTLVQTIILIILFRYLIEVLSVEKVGVWSIVLSSVSVAKISELGLAGSVTKFVSAHHALGDEQAAAETIQTAFISIVGLIALILVLVYPALVLALPKILPPSGLEDGQKILPFGLLSLWLTSAASIWMSGLDSYLRSDLRAGIMIFGSLIFLLISLLTISDYGLLGLAIAQVVQGTFLVIIGWVCMKFLIKPLPLLPSQWKLSRFREMLGYGINFQINSVVMLFFEPTTKILLGHFGELTAAGYFEMGQRLVMQVRALIVESNRVIVPVFSGLKAKSLDVNELYIKNMHYLIFFGTLTLSGLLAFIPIISDLWVGSYQDQFVFITASLILAWFINTMTAPVYFAYLGQGRLRWVTLAHIVMGITNILLGILLGNQWGWVGILVAFTVSLVIGSLIPFWAYHREHKLGVRQIINIYDIILIIVCFGTAIAILTTYEEMIDNNISIWERTLIVSIVVSLIMLSTAWFHPIRHQLFTFIKIRFQHSKEQ